MKQITPEEGQRVDRRALCAPLREHRDTILTVFGDTKTEFVDCYIIGRVDTGGMAPAECVTEIGSEPSKIARWNEAPDYPHFGEEDGQPRRQRVPEGGAIAIGLLIAVAAALFLIFR